MERALLVLLACAVLGLALMGWRLEHVQSELKGAQEDAQRLADDLKAARGMADSLTRAAGVQARQYKLLQEQQAKESNALTQANAANPDWAGERVPDDVARALGVQYPTAPGEGLPGRP